MEGMREIVRVSEVNLDGNKKLGNAIMGVKGIGKTLANQIVIVSGYDPNSPLGLLKEDDVKKIEDAINNPSKYGIPRFMLNRRSDPITGEDNHLVSSKLKFAVKSDIDALKKMRCYKGIRHEIGLPVRGQRTRTSFRGGRAVGVAKKKEQRTAARKDAPKAAAAPKGKK
ncbi:MAG: 30S ribosomal protein S13 [Candidatus Aenigmarchaeota archaeon]|nr:30S ribosomal protein S13 [Candidatus Aenigmarchaeota archaeon]